VFSHLEFCGHTWPRDTLSHSFSSVYTTVCVITTAAAATVGLLIDNHDDDDNVNDDKYCLQGQQKVKMWRLRTLDTVPLRVNFTSPQNAEV